MHSVDIASLSMHHIVILAIGALFSGFVDAVVGAGGLFLLITFFSLSLNPTYAIGTYKIIALFGTFPLLYRLYKSKVAFDMQAPKWAFLVVIPFSAIGILLVKYFTADIIKNIITTIACIMLTYKVINRKNIVLQQGAPMMPSMYFHIIVLPIIIMYNGLIGVGSTIILMTAYLIIMKSTTNSALWSSRLLMYMSELTASSVILYNMLFDIRLAMYLLPIYAIGSDIGVRLALKIGPKFINILVIASLSIMVIYACYERYYGLSFSN